MPRLPRSLFGQLVLSQIVLMAIVAICLPLLVSYLLNQTDAQFDTARLTRSADMIEAGWRSGKGQPEKAALADPDLLGVEGRSYAVFDANGAVIEQGAHPLPVPFSAVVRGAKPILFLRSNYDVLSVPAVAPDTARRRWVVIAQDRTVPDEIVDDVIGTFLSRFLWIVPVLLLASLLISLLLIRRVTGNFRRMAAEADAISLHRIDRRLDETDLPSEAQPLVAATNRALDRLEAGYRFQGEFVGNVSHELRTPLALISLRAEALAPSPERELIQSAVERANRVVRQLMEIAAIDRHYPQIEPFDPCAMAREMVGVMAPLVFRADHVIAYIEPDKAPAAVQGVPDLVQIALTNLIDNAIRHTPRGSSITVSVEPDGAMLVEDDGPGLVLPYRRKGGGSANRDSAGLGLAIVERIMTVCGGAMVMEKRPLGGSRVMLRLAPVG
jgi:signal transduction histidine kinase